MDTFIRRDGRILGPFSAEEFQDLLAAGKVERSDELSAKESDREFDWMPAESYPGVLPEDLAD